jgi:hypothetical protein
MRFPFNFSISLVVLFFIPIACLAQDPITSLLVSDSSRSIYIGLDVSKNIPSIFQNYFFQKSRIVEGTAMFSIGDRTFSSFSLGYSYLHANPVFKNLNYSNEGIHIKVGADYMPLPVMGIGRNLIISSYQEYGKFTMKGTLLW